MFYSGYLSLYLLQFLNMKLSHTKLIQTAHTTIDGLIDDALFPENGPVFMQRFHEVHPVRKSSGEKIERRFGESYAPETEQTIEAFNDRLITDLAAYDYSISTDSPIQILYKSTGYMPIFDNDNPFNRDNIMQGDNTSLLNVYHDYKAMETTVHNDNINRKYKTDVTTDIADIVMNESATRRPILFEPYGPTFTPKMHEDYPTESKSLAQGFDFVLDGPDFDPKLYDENHPISTEKSIQRFSEPLFEPSFTIQNFDVTQIQTTKIKKTTRKLNRTVLKKIAAMFYPTLETTAKRSHRTRKGRLKQRPRFINPIASKSTIQRLVGAQKFRPAFIQQSDHAIKETTTKKLNIPLINYLAFMQEQRNPRTKDTTIQRFNEPLRNSTDFNIRNYDVNLPKPDTEIQRFDGPLKHASEFEAKVNEHNYPPASETTDFMKSHNLNSLLTETAIQKFKKPLSNELSFVERRQQNPTISDKTIQRFNGPLRNGPDLIQNFNAHHDLPTIETATRKTNDQRFDGPLKHAPEFEAKINENKYPPASETTDFRQTHDLNYLKIETASQPLREAPKHKKVLDAYPQKSETTIQRLKIPLRNEPGLNQKVNKNNYPPPIENTDSKQNHDFNSPKIGTANQPLRGAPKHRPTYKKVMDVTYPQKSETTIQRLKKPLSNRPDFGQKVNKNNYPPALETKDFKQNQDLNFTKIERASQPLRGTLKNKPTFINEIHETYPQKRETIIQRFNKPLKNGADFDQKANVNYYPSTLETTDLRQNHDFNSPKIETAIQPLRGTPKHKLKFIKEIRKKYPQKSETTIQRLKKPLKNAPVFDHKVNVNYYPQTLVNTDFRQNHDFNSRKIETASQPLRGTPKRKPTFINKMHETYAQKRETTIQKFKKPQKNRPEFDQKVNEYYYPPALETTNVMQSHDLKSPKIETGSKLFRDAQKRKPTFKKVMEVTYTQKSEITTRRLKIPLRNGPDFDQRINEGNFPPALQTGSTFKQKFDVTVPQKGNYGVQRLTILPSFLRASKSYGEPLSNLNPSFRPKIKLEMQKSYTMTNLVSPAYIRSTATQPPIAETGIIYPWVKTAYPPGSNLESTVSYSPITDLANPWATTREVFAETSKSYYVPYTTPVYEVEPQVLRAPVPEPTQLEQETYTNIDKATEFPMFAENFVPKQESQAEISEAEEDGQTVAESPESEEDSNILAASSELEEDEAIEKKEEYRGVTEKIGLNQEVVDVVGEGTDPFLEEDEAIEKKEEYQGVTEKIGLNQEVVDVVGEGTDPFLEEDEAIEKKEEYQSVTEKNGLNQEAADVVGEGTDPFSMFLRKLVKVLLSKNIKELRNLIQPLGRYVTTLVDSGKLMKLGILTGAFIAQATPLLRAPVKLIQRHLFIAQVSLENRRRMLDDGTNTLLDELDDVYDAGEEEAMQKILSEITMYPNTSRSEEEIVKDFVDDIFLHPMHRMAGTTQGNVVFEYIGKFCNKYQTARRNAKPEEHTIIGPITVSEGKEISTKLNYIGIRGITPTEVEKISSKHDISPKGVTSMEEERNIEDSYLSDDDKYSSGERSQVEIRIKINRGKHHENNVCKYRKNCVNIRKRNEEDSSRSTTKKTKDILVGNTVSEKTIKDDHEWYKPENKEKDTGKNTAKVKVKLDCEHLPVILSGKKVGKGNGTRDPLTEMIMFCSNANNNDPDGSDPSSSSSDTSDTDT